MRKDLGYKYYELSNHLGNVLTVVTDRKYQVDDNYDYTTDRFSPDIVSTTDYYAFGQSMPGRTWSSTTEPSYSFGFNGKTKDNELKGNDNSYDFGARLYDPRTGRWGSVDAYRKKYPSHSSYNFCLNNPIIYLDPDGNDVFVAFKGSPGNRRRLSLTNSGVAGEIAQDVLNTASTKGLEMDVAVYEPGITVDGAVKDAFNFIIEHYSPNEKIIIYGYSNGGDAAVELCEMLKKAGLQVDLLITVDAADGPGFGTTVNNKIPDNVKYNFNEFQRNMSIIFSRGRENIAKDKEKTKIFNHDLTKLRNISHGTMDKVTAKINMGIIQTFISKKITPLIKDLFKFNKPESKGSSDCGSSESICTD